MFRTLRLLHQMATGRERFLFRVLLAGLTLAAIVETAAVATIFPFVAAVTDPRVVGQSRVGAVILELLDLTPGRDALVPIGVVTLVMILISSVISGLTTWVLQRFMWSWLHALSSRLLVRYLRQSYDFFLGRNTSELAKNLLYEVEVAVVRTVIPTITALARGMVAVGLLGLLLLVEPVVALGGLLLIGSAYGIVYLVVRGRQARLGRERLAYNDARYRYATEALAGIKEVKIFGRESLFTRRFDQNSRGYARTTADREVVGLLPRYFIEAVALGGALALVLAMLGAGRTPQEVLPIVSVFAFAGYKLLPAVQQLFYSATNVRFHTSTIDRLHADLTGAAPVGAGGGGEGEGEGGAGARAPRLEGSPRTPGEAMPPSASPPGDPPPLPVGAITVHDLSFRYRDADRDALSGVTLELHPGHHYGFVGRTGSGKTTLLDLLLGLLEPDRGEIRVGGRLLDSGTRERWRHSVGYVPQEIFLLDASIRANIVFGLADRDVDEARLVESVRAAALDDVIEELPKGLDTVIGERGVRLSGGQRQRIGIARALYLQPEIVFFDEGTSALDGATEARVVRNLRERGALLLMVAHRLASVQDADRIFVFEQGRLVAQGDAAALERESEIWRALAQLEPETA